MHAVLLEVGDRARFSAWCCEEEHFIIIASFLQKMIDDFLPCLIRVSVSLFEQST
jgi:hypothetical protein